MPNPKGINQYSKGRGGAGKPAAKGGITKRASLKREYQKATKAVGFAKRMAKTNSMPGMNSDYSSRGGDQRRINQATSAAKSLKAAYRKAK